LNRTCISLPQGFHANLSHKDCPIPCGFPSRLSLLDFPESVHALFLATSPRSSSPAQPPHL
ncbi:hypothetical protein NPIL_462051, partial [Nephila pilipes]